jgi:hypothetical protein
MVLFIVTSGCLCMLTRRDVGVMTAQLTPWTTRMSGGHGQAMASENRVGRDGDSGAQRLQESGAAGASGTAEISCGSPAPIARFLEVVCGSARLPWSFFLR